MITSKEEGYYTCPLWPEPKARHWYVAVVDLQARPLSPPVRFETDTIDCDPNGAGHQWVTIDFKRNY